MLQDTKELGIETYHRSRKTDTFVHESLHRNNKRNTMLYYAKINFLRIEVKYIFITFFSFFSFNYSCYVDFLYQE